LVVALLGACAQPGSQRIVGPDGSPMAHVHCGSDQGTCFRIAGELCPGGYEIRPVLASSDGNFLVRCREMRQPVVAQVTATPPATPAPPAAPAPPMAVTATPTPRSSADAWPPRTDPWPPANPWPTSQANAATTQAKPGGESIDIGY
jgi:hypothetical protein